jgi:hypothetical protein
MSIYERELEKRMFLARGIQLGFSQGEMSELTGLTEYQVKHTMRRIAEETEQKTVRSCVSLTAKLKKMSVEEYSEYLFAVGMFAYYMRNCGDKTSFALKVILSYEDYLSNYKFRKDEAEEKAKAAGETGFTFPDQCYPNVFYKAVSKLNSGCLVLERCPCKESFSIYDAGMSDSPDHYDRPCPCVSLERGRKRLKANGRNNPDVIAE